MRVKTGSGHIKVARAGAVLGITFERPEKKNALDGPMYLAATEALQSAGSDPSIGAILFAGAGGVFTFGAPECENTIETIIFFHFSCRLKIPMHVLHCGNEGNFEEARYSLTIRADYL
jgi:Enoyl-CoA hydratase/isomerase